MKTLLRNLISWALCTLIVLPQFTYAQLVNMSTRIDIAADQVLITGLVISTETKVLIRVVGPSLANFGVTNAIEDPGLELYQGNTRLLGNDDWETQSVIPGTPTPTTAEITAAAARVGAFPLRSGSWDSVILMTLKPGGYTIQGRNRTGKAGNILIEVYEIPTP